MKPCNTGTVIPTNNDPLPCEQFISSDCIIFQAAIAYLELPAGSTATQVIAAMLASLIDVRNRVSIIENQENPT